MRRKSAVLAGFATLLLSLLLTFATSSAANAKAYLFEGYYPTKAACEQAGEGYSPDPYECTDTTHHPDPWALYVFFIIPPP